MSLSVVSFAPGRYGPRASLRIHANRRVLNVTQRKSPVGFQDAPATGAPQRNPV